MFRLSRFSLPGVFLCALMPFSVSCAEPIKLMLLDGQNNHKWQETSPILQSILQASGRFQVDVVTSPPASAPADEYRAFDPKFSEYAAVLMNWNDYGVKNPILPAWMDRLIAYTESGGGLVLHHAAGLEYHPGFADVVGLVWQKADFGCCITLDATGNVVRRPKGEGTATGHGQRFEYPLTLWSDVHPITVGMPRQWRHTEDEAWFSQRGPALGLEILATAVAPETQANEPMVWTRQHGQGRVVVNRLGHDAKAMACQGFRALLIRSCEWAATGKASQPLPQPFPQADATAVAP